MIIVSVLMITYNHENFIREAIDGVLMQKTDFPIELIIGEDCSTDSTRKIVVEYAEKYPDLIRPLLPESNLGMMKNFIKTMEAAKGKYIALCEGDDYWTDPYKLQKQVDFLEDNTDYCLCCHRFSLLQGNSIIESKEEKKHIFQNKDYFDFDVELNLQHWFTQTLTVVFKKESLDFEYLNKMKYVFDSTLMFSILRNGKGRCLNQNFGVYRINPQGIFTGRDTVEYTRMYYDAWKSVYEIERDNLSKDNYMYFLISYMKIQIKKGSVKNFNQIIIQLNEYFRLVTFGEFVSTCVLLTKYLFQRVYLNVFRKYG